MEEQARAVRLIELTLYPYCMNVTSDPVIYYSSHCSILLFCTPTPSPPPPHTHTHTHFFRYLTEIQDMKCRQNSVCQQAGYICVGVSLYVCICTCISHVNKTLQKKNM